MFGHRAVSTSRSFTSPDAVAKEKVAWAAAIDDAARVVYGLSGPASCPASGKQVATQRFI